MVLAVTASARRTKMLVRGKGHWPDRTLHVVPLDDVKEHPASPSCWCNPDQDPEQPNVYIHHKTN